MTPRELRDVEPDVLERIGAAPRVFCFIDYDGTLAPLAPTPERAVPLPGSAALLAQLATAPGMHVAVVTGRTIADVRRHLDVPGIYYVGVHGVEVRLPSGARLRAPGIEALRAILTEIRPRLHAVVNGLPGIRLEDKGAALAVHYRLAAPADATAARAHVADIVQDCRARGYAITLAYGHEVAEIRPANVTKGTTMCALLASRDAAALAVYIGDDRTDEDAFEMLPPHSITILVGAPDTPTGARYRVANPQAVYAFLLAVLASRSGRLQASLSTRGAA